MRAVPYSATAAAEYAAATSRRCALLDEINAAAAAAYVAEVQWAACVSTVECLAKQIGPAPGQIGESNMQQIADLGTGPMRDYVQCNILLNTLHSELQQLDSKIQPLHAASQATHIFDLPKDVLLMILTFKHRQLCRRVRQIMQSNCKYLPVRLKLQNTAGFTNFQRLHADMLVHVGNYTSKVQRSYNRVSFSKLNQHTRKKYTIPVVPNSIQELIVEDAEDLAHLVSEYNMPNLRHIEIRRSGSCQKTLIVNTVSMSQTTYNHILGSQIVLLYAPQIVPHPPAEPDPVPDRYLRLCIEELGALPEYLQKS